MSNVGQDFIGCSVGNWQIVRFIDVGSFGSVYEAYHLAITARRAAVKLLHPHLSMNADAKRRFVNEANAASRVADEHIVQVFDGGVTDSGLCYVVMELLEGDSLKRHLSRGKLSLESVVRIGVQIATALQATHAAGIIHRDA